MRPERLRRDEEDIQHARGSSQDGCRSPNGQPLAGRWKDQAVRNGSHGRRAHTLALEHGRHSQGAQDRPHPRKKAEEGTCQMRAAIYARVSTTNHGQDVNLQLRELRQFAEMRGWTMTGEYVDNGV